MSHGSVRTNCRVVPEPLNRWVIHELYIARQ
jgi:hypothetical protein